MTDMRNTIVVASALSLFIGGCSTKSEPEAKTEAAAKAEPPVSVAPQQTAAQPAPVSAPVAATTKKLFLDVHEVGKGKVTAKDVAAAHKKDLATEGKYGVEYKAYWVDEKA